MLEKIQKKEKKLCKKLDKPHYISYFLKKRHQHIVFIRISSREEKELNVIKRRRAERGIPVFPTPFVVFNYALDAPSSLFHFSSHAHLHTGS